MMLTTVVTERTTVQQGKQREDEYSIHSRINAFMIRVRA